MENLIGLVLPAIIDYVNRYISDSRLRWVASLLVCLIVAVFVKFDELQTGNYSDVLGSVGMIFIYAQGVYKLYWEKSQIRAKLIN